ncbi:zinc ribbon domain-containing protein [Ornithinibacillus salinisoli]|uniref:Zinc ribbon domain-containing protein n=1 Tax=Ornithinibacillus salinisoli TaxID=1848459 RepID=A0ABW4W558_9BACI
MKCRNCGYKFPSRDIQFCPECGNKVKETHTKKFPKKFMMLLLTIGILFVGGLITFYFIGNAKYDPIHKISSFEEAISNENLEELTKLLTPYEDSFTIDEESTANLVDFFRKNPGSLQTIVNELKNKAAALEGGNTLSSDLYATITIEKSEKKWFLFHDYKLVVIPAFIEVYTTDNSVDLIIDGKTVDTTTEEGVHEKKYGPYMPGTHFLKAMFDNSYTTTENEQEVTLFQMENNISRHELQVNVGTFRIVSTFEEEATLFVNDQETDIIINKGNQVVGPFPLSEDIEIHLEKEMPWETVVSQKETISEDVSEIRMKKVSIISDQEEEKIIDIINDVFTTYTEALNARDASILMDNITDNMVKDLQEQIEYVEENLPDYEGTLRKAQYRLDWYQDPEYDKEVGAYVFDIDVMFTYYEPNGKLGRLFEGENEHEYERGVNVVLLFDEQANEWKVDQYENKHFFVFEDDPVYELD